MAEITAENVARALAEYLEKSDDFVILCKEEFENIGKELNEQLTALDGVILKDPFLEKAMEYERRNFLEELTYRIFNQKGENTND